MGLVLALDFSTLIFCRSILTNASADRLNLQQQSFALLSLRKRNEVSYMIILDL